MFYRRSEVFGIGLRCKIFLFPLLRGGDVQPIFAYQGAGESWSVRSFLEFKTNYLTMNLIPNPSTASSMIKMKNFVGIRLKSLLPRNVPAIMTGPSIKP